MLREAKGNLLPLLSVLNSEIYNMDEKGFIIGACQTTKRIFSRAAWKQGRRTQAMNDGSRDFISLLACICADGTALPPTLIYPSDSGDPLDTWVEDVKRTDLLHMSCSPTGWSNNAFGLAWLQQVFEPYTRRKHG